MRMKADLGRIRLNHMPGAGKKRALSKYPDVFLECNYLLRHTFIISCKAKTNKGIEEKILCQKKPLKTTKLRLLEK